MSRDAAVPASRFRCVPVATGVAARWRATGLDDMGNALLRRTADAPAGYPCRHCLRLAAPGEAMLLGSHRLPAPLGVYWTPSPVFLHAAPCPAYDAADEVAPVARHPDALVSVRAYDAGHLCLYDLGAVCGGEAVDAPLARALADPRTEFVNLHTARPGCFLCGVERIAAA